MAGLQWFARRDDGIAQQFDLEPLWASGRASSMARSPAVAMACGSGARPTSAASLRVSRHGIGATPPAANFASTIMPFSTRSTAATDTTANSKDARSRTFQIGRARRKAGCVRDMNACDKLTCCEIRFALRRLGGQPVEIEQRKAPRSSRSEDLDLGIQCRQRHRQIRGVGRDARLASAE